MALRPAAMCSHEVSTARLRAGGFTLIELIVVLILVGVLAVAVIPRFSSLDGFDAAGFGDQAQSILRYGQKSAVAQRRNVSVSISTSAASMCSYSGAPLPCNAACAGASDVTAISLPGGKYRPAQAATMPAVTYCFDAVGRPYQGGAALAATASISVSHGAAVVKTIRIEPETGYVH